MVGTHLLPPNLLKLFAPRPPLPYLKPLGRDPDVPLRTLANRLTPLSVSETLARVREEKAENEAKHAEEGTAGEASEQGLVLILGEEARKVRKEEKAKQRALALEHGIESYDPAEDQEIAGDPYKTLFVGRLPLACTEDDLRREFEIYGYLERVRLVTDKEGKSKGYAFIVYEREKDMKAAYKNAEGLKLLNKRLLIDVERGRTVKDWKPRRLGGGLGGRPKPIIAAPADNFSNFQPPRGGNSFPMRGGGRGGFVQRGGYGDRGGFGGGDRGGRGGFGGGNFGGGDRGNFNNNRGGGGGGFDGGRGNFGGGGGQGGFNGGGGDRGNFNNNNNFGGQGGPGNFQGGPDGGRGGFQGGGDRGGGFGGRGGNFGGGGGFVGRGGGGQQASGTQDNGYGARRGGMGGGGMGGGGMGGGGMGGGGMGGGGMGGGEKRDGGGMDGGYGDQKRPRY